MYAKLKYIVLLLLLVGSSLLAFSYYKLADIGLNSRFYLPAIFVGLLVIFFFLPRSLKMKSKLLTFTALGIATILCFSTLQLTMLHFDLKRSQEIFTTYHALNCEQMEAQFAKDLQNDELKYFSSGFVGSGKFSKSLKKYNIENIFLGCTLYGNLDCYSQLVSTYLKEEKNINISKLYE